MRRTNRADKDAGRLVAERYGDRRRDAQTGENLYAPVFSSRGVLRNARGFLCADSPGRMSGEASREANGKTAGKPAVFVSEGYEQHRDGKGDDG